MAQNKVPANVLLFTPGVNLADKGDAKGQQYNTPEHVFKNLHTDFVIVGREFTNLKMPKICKTLQIRILECLS